MNGTIVHLPKDKWKGTILPIEYTTKQYYDVVMNKKESGFQLEIEKKEFEQPVSHTQEENDFPDRLYADYYEHAFAWGVRLNEELIAAVETVPEQWSNRLRITELWVAEEYRRQGIGHALIEIVKEQARLERRRAVILETQSCNVNAVDFYLHEGFELIGLDTCCYKNNDLQRKEVRLEFGWMINRKSRLQREEVEIREINEEDWYEVERMTQHAFWNKHAQGCNEHLLVYKLRKHEDYLSDLSRVAVKDGTEIGAILYSKAKIVDDGTSYDVVTFGPLSVEPEWQGCGVGEHLLRETMVLAANQEYLAILLYGEPDYYPRIGFKTCDNYQITTPDGKNFDAFMGIELIKNGLHNIKGKFYESKVFDNLPMEEADEYNKLFPKREKVKFPCQWE